MEPDVRSHRGTYALSAATGMSGSHLHRQPQVFLLVYILWSCGKGSVCKQSSDALLRAVASERSVEGLAEIRPTSQHQSHPNSANTDHFCSPCC